MARPGNVDVFLAALSQQPAAHGGPIGRITALQNGIATHYTGATQSANGPTSAKLKIETRAGFAGLSTVLRNADSGSTASGAWIGPEVLDELGGQLVSTCKSVPRVWNGTDFTYYGSTRVIADVLSESVYHTTDRVIQVSSHAKIGAVSCSVWTEITYSPVGNPIGTSFVGFKSGETWVRTPSVLHGPGVANQPVLAKVVTDGVIFWTFTNEDATGHILVKTFDTHGVQLASKAITKNSTTSPGDWDVAFLTASHVVLIQPTDGTGAADGVDFSTLTYATGVITEVVVTDATVHCRGALSWLTNDLNGLGYLATLGTGDSPAAAVWGYQATGAGQSHEYNLGIFVNDRAFLDSFVGWPIDSGTPNHPTLFIGVAYLADGTSTAKGPVFDPIFRQVTVYSCDWADTVTTIRENLSTVPVSRAFLHNGEYFYFSYYQSGSGTVTSVDPVTVSFTAGDYMTGPVEQPQAVKSGDHTQGNALVTTGHFGSVSNSESSVAITSGDKVELYTVQPGDCVTTAGGTTDNNYIPVGTQILRWTMQIAVNGTGYWNSKLSISSCSEPSADGQWEIFLPTVNTGGPGSGSHVFFTKLFNNNGTTVVPAIFTSGSVEILSYTFFQLRGLIAWADPPTIPNLLGGTVVVSGSTNSSFNGTFSFASFAVDSKASPNSPYWLMPAFAPDGGLVLIATTTETGGTYDAFNATVTPILPEHWAFNSQTYDDSYIGTFLTVADPSGLTSTPPADLATFKVTSSSGGGDLATTSGDAVGTIAHVWSAPPYPTVTISQDITQAFRIRLGSVTFDYSFIGALIVISGDTGFPTNNGVYKVLSLDTSDTSNHTVFVAPTTIATNQRNQMFIGTETITLFPPTNVAPEIQPVWFLTPLTGTQPQVGCFERGLADADWRQEGQIVSAAPYPNLYPRALANVTPDFEVLLPYRARSFIAGQLLKSPTGQVVNAASTLLQSTIGLKVFSLTPDAGTSLASFDELLMPGPLAASFTESGFHEQGINVGVEAPFIVSEEADTDPSVVGLVPLQKYIYQVVATAVDENGDHIVSVPSPVLEVTLTGTNNTATIGGRTLNPLGTDGVPVIGAFGVSNRVSVVYSIFRTAVVNGVPTTNLYEITDPLNSNGPLYSGSGPGSGFTFLSDQHTWYFRDQIADAVITRQDVIYTGQGFLPAFPAPPFSQGVVWQNRTWLCGYDGAVWISNEKQEGSGLSFFPAWRYVFPARAVAVASLDTALYVFTDDGTIWAIPAATYPDATGNPQSGSFPTPRKLPFRNSCTGFATTIREGVVYSSTAGAGSQLWLITRGQQNVWLSQPIQDSLSTITGLAVDSKQRLYVTTGVTLWCYDGIPELWSQVVLPSLPLKIATLGGALAWQDSARVAVQTPGTHADVLGGTTFPVPLDITLAGLTFAQVRAYQRLWALQLVGEYRGPHQLNAILSYPDDMPGFPDQFLTVPDPSKPYLIEINPTNELCSQFGLRVFSTFNGIGSPADSFTLEVISAKVGLREGQRDVPADQRSGSTG